MRSLNRSSLVAVAAGSVAAVACGAGAWADPIQQGEQLDSPVLVQEFATPVSPQPSSTVLATPVVPTPAEVPTSQPSTVAPAESPVPAPSVTEPVPSSSAGEPTPTSPVDESQSPAPSDLPTAAPTVNPTPAPTAESTDVPGEETQLPVPEESDEATQTPVSDITGATADPHPGVSPSPITPEPTEHTVEPVAPTPPIEATHNEPVQPVSPDSVVPQPAPSVAPEQPSSPNASLPVPAPNVPQNDVNPAQVVAPRFSVQSSPTHQEAPAQQVPSSEQLPQSAHIIEQANRPLMTFGVQSKPDARNDKTGNTVGSTLGSIFHGSGSLQEGQIPGAAEWVSSYLDATEPKERGRLTAGSNFGVNGAKDTKSVAGGSNTYGNVMRGESLISGSLPLAAFSALALTSIAVIIRIFIATNRKS
ncbi:hypothetical protein [Rothia terrae]|uniref:Uncharacterized protein n=1 Tax=Rothia terrae TaxID=396015 RepID=A0A7H2BG14_9MICC|nr:hypothetical protein [Rothia terrae]QNV38610.1 hypothetical protein IDM49_04980 [Rothia terrae]